MSADDEGFKNSEIQRLDASVEETQAHEEAKITEYDRVGDSDKIGKIAGVLSPKDENSPENKKKKEREKSSLMEALRKAQRDLQELLEKLQKQLDQAIEDRDELYDSKDALTEALNTLENCRTIELGEDGYPKNEKLKEAIKAYEQASGKKFSEADNITLYLLAVNTHNNHGIKALDQEIAETSEKIGEISNQAEILKGDDVTEADIQRANKIMKTTSDQTFPEEKPETNTEPVAPSAKLLNLTPMGQN